MAGAYERPEPRGDDGYRYWRWSHAPRDGWPSGHAYAEWVRARGHDLGELIRDPAGVPAELHQTTWCAEQTIDFMRERRDADTPWLATVNIYDPHEPFNPPAKYRAHFDPEEMPGPLFRPSDLRQQHRLRAVDFQGQARDPAGPLDIAHPVLPFYPGRDSELEADEATFARDAKTLQAAYYAMIALIDDQVGRMLDALDESGQAERTLVVFTSDHGESLGDHGLIRKGCRFYEGLVRVPLILRWPGRIESGRVSNDLVELTDLAPTLLAAAGQPVPPWMQGRSLLEGGAGRESVRSEYFDAIDEPGRQLRDHVPHADAQVGRLSRPRPGRALRPGSRSGRVPGPVGRAGRRRHQVRAAAAQLRRLHASRRRRGRGAHRPDVALGQSHAVATASAAVRHHPPRSAPRSRTTLGMVMLSISFGPM